jgi:death-on-curing family protein
MSSSATKVFRFLTASQVRRLYTMLVADATPTQPSLLESAVASPMNIKHYGHQNNIFQLAANMSEKIMKNHAFSDGNKRAALVAADMFLKINGYQLQAKPMAEDKNNQGLKQAHIAVTTEQWDAEKLGRYYENIATPIESWTEEILEYRKNAQEY